MTALAACAASCSRSTSTSMRHSDTSWRCRRCGSSALPLIVRIGSHHDSENEPGARAATVRQPSTRGPAEMSTQRKLRRPSRACSARKSAGSGWPEAACARRRVRWRAVTGPPAGSGGGRAICSSCAKPRPPPPARRRTSYEAASSTWMPPAASTSRPAPRRCSTLQLVPASRRATGASSQTDAPAPCAASRTPAAGPPSSSMIASTLGRGGRRGVCDAEARRRGAARAAPRAGGGGRGGLPQGEPGCMSARPRARACTGRPPAGARPGAPPARAARAPARSPTPSAAPAAGRSCTAGARGAGAGVPRAAA